MKYKKGQSGNPAGKPKGTKNSKTLEWEEFGKELLSSGTIKAKLILESADPDTFMKYFIQLVEYFAPKQSRIENNTTNESNVTVKVDWDFDGIEDSTTKTS